LDDAPLLYTIAEVCVKAKASRMIFNQTTNATRLMPWCCATTLPLFALSCAPLNAQEPPWEGCRVASEIEYESAKRDFLLQTSVGAYAMTGHWWRRYYWYCRL
jgi:hypothetical protein